MMKILNSFPGAACRYNIPKGGKGLQEPQLKQYTAEFMLTRGDYAMLGYSWYGCTGSAAAGGGASPDPPRAKEWGKYY